MAKTRKTRGKGTKLAGQRRMRGKGFAMDLAKSQGPSIAASLLGAMVEMGLKKLIGPPGK